MKNAIIHLRTSQELKDRIRAAAKANSGYTMTRLLEEGAELVLAKLENKG